MTEQSKSQAHQPSNAELYQRGLLYDAVAQLLPLEGRDFTIELKYKPKLRARVVGKTELGRAFAKHCQENLRSTMQELANDRATPTRQPDKKEMMEALAKAFRKKGAKANVGPKRANKSNANACKSTGTARSSCARTTERTDSNPAVPGQQSVL